MTKSYVNEFAVQLIYILSVFLDSTSCFIRKY